MTNILDFLQELSQNNTREWMQENKKRYLSVKGEFEGSVQLLIDKIALFDPYISGVDTKKCVFRINRDIRFSKDKRPYKDNMGAFINKDGKKGVDGGYYIHIQPGQSMLAGGVYMPPSDILKKVRQEIDYNPDQLLKFMESSAFKKYFKTFEGQKLKKAPKGYDPEHPNIELLRLKYYIVVHRIGNNALTKSDFLEYASEIFKAMKPLNDYLRIAIND
jgi:uncharacterized protein (TIGR02453 family)